MSDTPTEPTPLGPAAYSEFVGQSKLKARLSVSIEAAVAQKRPLDHVLLTGPKGCGKTTLAHLIADQLGDPIQVITRPVTDKELLEKLYELDEAGSGVLFIDEAHRLTKGVQESLLPLAQGGRFETRWGDESFEWLTIILATTEVEKIVPPLWDRMMIRPPFEPYSDEEMAQIVTGMAERAGVTINSEECLVLARATAGAPRMAKALVLATRDLSVRGPVSALAVLAHCEVEPDGLTKDHLNYLRCLRELGSIAGLDPISTRLRLHASVVKEIERLLVDRRFIRYERTGRALSADGRRRLEGQPEREPRRGRRDAA